MGVSAILNSDVATAVAVISDQITAVAPALLGVVTLVSSIYLVFKLVKTAGK